MFDTCSTVTRQTFLMPPSMANLLKNRGKKRKTAPEAAKPAAKKKPRTTFDKLMALFESKTSAETSMASSTVDACAWGKEMVSCFWQIYQKFDIDSGIASILDREQPNFIRGYCAWYATQSKKPPKDTISTRAQGAWALYVKERRLELGAQMRKVNLNLPAAPQLPLLSTVPPEVSLAVPDSGSPTIPTPQTPVVDDKSGLCAQRRLFYQSGTISGTEDVVALGSAAMRNVVNRLQSGDILYATGPTQRNPKGVLGAYSRAKNGDWGHVGEGSHWTAHFVPALDRIAQSKASGSTPVALVKPTRPQKDGLQPLCIQRVGEGKYSQIFVPTHMRAADPPPDLTGWPLVLTRTDEKGVRRPKNVAIRLPRLDSNDRAVDDGSMCYAPLEAKNLVEAAMCGFGAHVHAAFFIPEPNPPLAEPNDPFGDEPNGCFRFLCVLKLQTASLQARSNGTAFTTLPSHGIDPRPRYFQLLFNTIFEYSARRILFLDATRSNFMDEETVVRATPQNDDIRLVGRVNVIDLDQRFYRRLEGANVHAVWLFNIVLVLAHLRRADCKHQFVDQMLTMKMENGMPLCELIRNVYEANHNDPASAWLFKTSWDQLPSSWQPDTNPDWKTSIGLQMQQLVGHYFYYSERSENGEAALEAYLTARRCGDAKTTDSAKARFNSYLNHGGMTCARHFLITSKDKTVTSLLDALLLFINAHALLKRPCALRCDPFHPPRPLPSLMECITNPDPYLGLSLRPAARSKR